MKHISDSRRISAAGTVPPGHDLAGGPKQRGNGAFCRRDVDNCPGADIDVVEPSAFIEPKGGRSSMGVDRQKRPIVGRKAFHLIKGTDIDQASVANTVRHIIPASR